MRDSFSSEDPGAGGFLIPDGTNTVKPTKQNSHYRHTDIGDTERCGNCSMFTPTSADTRVGHCDLGWQAVRNYVCDHWSAQHSTLHPDLTDPVGEPPKRGIHWPGKK